MGISKDLDLRGNDFSNVATFLFVGLLCFELPNSEPSPDCGAPFLSLTSPSLLPPKDPRRQVARLQRHLLGRCHCLRRRCQ